MFAGALALTLSAVVAAAAGAEKPQLKVVFPGLSGVGKVRERLGFYTDHLDQQMTFAGADTVTSKEIATVLGLERQKQLAGCADESESCTTELAGALGADVVLVGDVAEVGDDFQLNLKLLGATNGKTVSAYSDSVSGEVALLETLARGGRILVEQAAGALGRRYIPSVEQPMSAMRKASLGVGGAGLIACVVGGVFLIKARTAYDGLLPNQPISTATGRNLQREGESAQVTGAIALGAGVAALGAGAALFVLGKDRAMSTSVGPVEGGGVGVSVGGTW
jgi:hypothetical protein